MLTNYIRVVPLHLRIKVTDQIIPRTIVTSPRMESYIYNYYPHVRTVILQPSMKTRLSIRGDNPALQLLTHTDNHHHHHLPSFFTKFQRHTFPQPSSPPNTVPHRPSPTPHPPPPSSSQSQPPSTPTQHPHPFPCYFHRQKSCH